MYTYEKIPEANLVPYQASMMSLFAKTVYSKRQINLTKRDSVMGYANKLLLLFRITLSYEYYKMKLTKNKNRTTKDSKIKLPTAI